MAEEHERKTITVGEHQVLVHWEYDPGKANLLQQKIRRLGKHVEDMERYSASAQAELAETIKNWKAQILEGETLYSEGFRMQSPEDYYVRVDAFLARKE